MFSHRYHSKDSNSRLPHEYRMFQMYQEQAEIILLPSYYREKGRCLSDTGESEEKRTASEQLKILVSHPCNNSDNTSGRDISLRQGSKGLDSLNSLSNGKLILKPLRKPS